MLVSIFFETSTSEGGCMYHTALRFIGAPLLFAASLSIGFSQTSTANLTGLITDPAGAAIPDVKIKLEHAATHEQRVAVSGAEGRFSFSQILPGTYDLVAEAAGFKSFAQRGII